MAKDPARSSKTFLNRDSHHVTRSLCSCLLTHTSEQFDNNSVLQTRANFPATAEGFFLVPPGCSSGENTCWRVPSTR